MISYSLEHYLSWITVQAVSLNFTLAIEWLRVMSFYIMKTYFWGGKITGHLYGNDSTNSSLACNGSYHCYLMTQCFVKCQ